VAGSYMKALERDVLQAALEVQDELLGPTVDFKPSLAPKNLWSDDFSGQLTPGIRDSLHAINGLSNQSWFFHSPLLYWSCSSKAIAKDDDIIATVNEGSRLATSVNVTLRHSNVFSGKRFEDHRLVAADALVITLLHKLDSPVGAEWERKVETLAKKAIGKWRLYPEDGHVLTSQLYEFRFQPLSFQDDVLLGLAYGLTLVYFLLSLTKLRALKSRFGLSVTVVVQIALSIMSSFTICAILKIDLSKIPREAYPLVVLTVGLENIFRLINAVIITPAESPTALRIAEALGQTGHTALAGVAQNLFILWLLAKVVSPGVAAFCHFAAIALTFDFLYLLSFFVAVLSVEVRRTELSDSLDPSGHRPKHRILSNVRSRHTWIDALLHGDIPISTRVSGTIVMVGFVLIAQWHFFDHESPTQTMSRLLQLIWLDHKASPSSSELLSIDVNQARTPTAWLRLQDHETAREVIQVIKPNSHSYIARVYDPLILVLEGSDRNSSGHGVRFFLPAVYDFLKHESTHFITTVLFIVAAVSLLMNFLLWDEEAVDLAEYDDRAKEEPLLALKTLNKGHVLDVVMLTTSPDGVVVSVGLDRRIRVWDIRQDVKAYIVETRLANMDLFPIVAITVDDHANWLALLCANGHIMVWNIPARRWTASAKVEIKGSSPTAFLFATSQADAIPGILLVRSNGIMSAITIIPDAYAGVKDLWICDGTLVCCRPYLENGKESPLIQFSLLVKGVDVFPRSLVPVRHFANIRCVAPASTAPPFLITVSRQGSMHLTRVLQNVWTTEEFNPVLLKNNGAVLFVVLLPMLKVLLAVRQDAVDVVDVESRQVVYTFRLINAQPSSLRCFYSTRRTPHFGSNGLGSFSLIYTETESGDCVLQTYLPAREEEILCINTKKYPPEQPYCPLENAVMRLERINAPGKWEALPVGVIVGVRKIISPVPESAGSSLRHLGISSSSLRRRGHNPKRPHASSNADCDDVWEVWLLSAKGERTSISLSVDEQGDTTGGQLLVTSCGPMTRIGQRSVAVGFGNVIKVVTVGHERFTIEESSDDIALAMASRRRKQAQTRKRSDVCSKT
jgi:hypothetical protein